MANEQSPLDMQARLTMKVIRKDGTVEYVEQPWEEVSEEGKSNLLKMPSFKEWLKSKREGN